MKGSAAVCVSSEQRGGRATLPVFLTGFLLSQSKPALTELLRGTDMISLMKIIPSTAVHLMLLTPYNSIYYLFCPLVNEKLVFNLKNCVYNTTTFIPMTKLGSQDTMQSYRIEHCCIFRMSNSASSITFSSRVGKTRRLWTECQESARGLSFHKNSSNKNTF